ncbi:MAG: peptidoglycan-associated lipoprotein Pal [Methylococcales bacterium]|nr:peptidoglycan-associated lipoprotein Pal [Methylococcales bacterium]
MAVKPLFSLLSALVLLTACSADNPTTALPVDEEAALSVTPFGASVDTSDNTAITSTADGLPGLSDEELMTEVMPGQHDGFSYDNAKYPNAFVGPEFATENNPLAKSVIYFQYDSSQVQQDFLPVINAHAKHLVKHPFVRITLAGHADERGSPEYNIALGEYRAKAVARLMKIQGVTDDQLQIVSYGEEKPARLGHDEASWQLNRRVEILYQGK